MFRMRSSSSGRYPSALTDEQWALIESMVPVRPGGRPTIHPRRRTVYWYFKRWNAEGITDRIHDALRAAVRDGASRDPDGQRRHRGRPG